MSITKCYEYAVTVRAVEIEYMYKNSKYDKIGTRQTSEIK